MLTGRSTDPMLGALPSVERTETVCEVPNGSTVLFYTDGLIERRDRDLDEGSAALVQAAGDLRGQSAETVCATLTDRLLPGQEHEDDVCLLVVRVAPAE